MYMSWHLEVSQIRKLGFTCTCCPSIEQAGTVACMCAIATASNHSIARSFQSCTFGKPICQYNSAPRYNITLPYECMHVCKVLGISHFLWTKPSIPLQSTYALTSKSSAFTKVDNRITIVHNRVLTNLIDSSSNILRAKVHTETRIDYSCCVTTQQF